MTKRHFVAIAADIRFNLEESTVDSGEEDVLETLARDLCRTFSGFNSNFDRGRFLAACGVEG